MAVVTKRRSRLFYRARESLNCVGDLNGLKREDLDYVNYCFGAWIDEYNKGKVGVLNKCDSVTSHSEYLFIRQFTRFQDGYRKMVFAKLRRLDNIEFKHHLILEVDPSKFMQFAFEFKWINIAWAKLRAWLYKKYGHFRFFRILEPHKSLRPHLHVLIADIPFIDYKELQKEWSVRLHCGFVFRKTIRSGFRAVLYVLKYVCKMVSGHKKFDSLFSSILFATNCRLFSMSRALSVVVNGGLIKDRVKKKVVEWLWLGSVRLEDFSLFLLEKKLVFDKTLQVTPSTEDLYAYPELFFVSSKWGDV